MSHKRKSKMTKDGRGHLEALPVEVHCHIGKFIPLEDILSCCATCSLLRLSFSDDRIWKKYCDIQVIEYLQRSESLVEPHFEWDHEEFSTLPPLGKWRKNYMMQTHLFKNWRNANIEREEFEIGPNNSVFSKINVQFYESDYLFLNTYSFNEDCRLNDVWDVTSQPFLSSTLKTSLYKEDHEYDEKHNPVLVYKIVSNKLVIAQSNLVLVYDISLSSPSFPLVHAFLFNESESDSKDKIVHDGNSVFLKTTDALVHEVMAAVSGNFFIGALRPTISRFSAEMHVWDIQTGKKVKVESLLPQSKLMNVQFLTSEDERDIVVKLRVSNEKHSNHCYGYDLSMMEYSSFSVKINYFDFYIFSSNHVVGVSSERLVIYNYKNSEKVLRKEYNHVILKDTLAVVGENLLLGTFENIVYVLNLGTLETINTVKLGFTLYSFHAICGKFVVVNRSNSEVWHIGNTAEKLFNMPINGSFLAVSPHFTKIAIEKENKIIILNFW